MKISKESRDFIKNGYIKELHSLVACSCIFILMGAALLICGIKANPGAVSVVRIIAILSVSVGITLPIFGIFLVRKKQHQLLRYIECFSFGTENATRAAILSFPDPMVVVTTDGIIRWYNPAFVQLCGKGNLFGENLQDIFPSIRLSVFAESKGIKQDFSYDGRDFIISGEVSSTLDRDEAMNMIGLSFVDISEITTLQKQLEEKKSVICTAVIDNYEEVLKETPNSNHGVLVGDIERCIGLWVEKGDGVYRRYERDKFFIIFEAAKFECLLNEKFAVLNDVKEIDQQNKIPVTLSIGVGCAGDDIRENDKLSLAALDMALGRGGDQAVMKTASGYTFFGAKSLGVEKTTKVKARVVAKSLCNLTDGAKNTIIMGHKGSDFDSFGAAVGLFRIIMNRSQNAYIAMDETHNNVGVLLRDFLISEEYSERIISLERAISLTDENTLIIIVDTHRPNMVEYPELLNHADKLAIIDHHRRSEDFIEDCVLTYHEPYASSTCEMVAEILQYMGDGDGISVAEAEALYCGIYMDTKGFTFKTGARTFEAAAYLRKIGVDPVGVHKLFRNDLEMYIQKSKVISNAKVYRDNIAIAVCNEASKNIQLVVAQAADDLLNIKGVEAAFVLAEIGSRIIISGRSLGAINVQVILEKLGGGGHITIAGAQLENNSITIAELKLRNAIDEVLFE